MIDKSHDSHAPYGTSTESTVQGMRAMSIATIFVAIAGYAIILIAARGLNAADYEIFMVFWGLFFAFTGVLDGLMQETARGVVTNHSARTDSPLITRPFATTLYISLAILLIVAVSSPWWVSTVTPTHGWWTAVLCTTGLACYAFQATVCGLLSAASQWKRFAWLMALDSGVRLILALIAWQAGWHIVAFLVVTVLGAGTWLLFLCDPTTRRLLSSTTDVSQRIFIRNTITAMLASGANALLITGFPALLKFTTLSTEATAGALAATITAVTLTRAPLLIPMQRFQPALIVYFTKRREAVLVASVIPIAVVATTAIIGGVAAWLIGQPLMGLLFPEELVAPAEVLGLLTLASGATAILMLTSSAALAADRHDLYLAGWVIATVISIAVMLLFQTPHSRAITALSIGPIAGSAIQLAVLARPTLLRLNKR